MTAPNRPEGHTRWPYRDGVRAQASGGGRQDRVGVSHAPNGPATNQHRSQQARARAHPPRDASTRRVTTPRRGVSLSWLGRLRPSARLQPRWSSLSRKARLAVITRWFFCLPGYVPEPVRSNGRARQAPTAGSGARTTPLLCSSSALQQVRFGAPYAGRSATYVDVHGCTWTVA